MTKTIERLNQSDPEADPSTTQDETVNESEDYGDIEDDCAMRINIHHMRCAVQTLQLAIKDGLKQPHYDKLLTKTCHIVSKLRTPKVWSLMKKIKKKKTANT